MKHVLDRTIDWITTNGDISGDGKSFTITSKNGADSKYIAGLHQCDDHELLHIGHYRTVNGEACGYSEIVLQIRDGEFSCMVPSDSQEDGDFLDRLNGIYSRHLRTSHAAF